MTITTQQKLGIVRHVLTCIGGILVTLGKVNDGQVEQIIGVIMVIAPMVWSVASKPGAPQPPRTAGTA